MVEQTRALNPPQFDDHQDIADIQFHVAAAPAGAHTWTWGGERRARGDDVVTNGNIVAFLPPRLKQTWRACSRRTRSRSTSAST